MIPLHLPFRLKLMPLLLGFLLFAASLTPSLIPRDWLVQGILGGLVAGAGYLIGSFFVGLWRVLMLPEPEGRIAQVLWTLVTVLVFAVVVLCMVKAGAWQNGIRARMEMPPAEAIYNLRMLLLAATVFVTLLVMGAGLRMFYNRVRHRLSRYMPARTADVAGLALVVIVLVVLTRDGVLDRVISRLDESYTTAQALFETAPPPPTDTMVAGSASSWIDWGAMGQPGRDYVTGGPDQAKIAAFTGRAAKQPLRVYVGLAQHDEPKARARIALQELIRVGGFDRRVLVVAIPTGTGWLDPDSMDALEYMHGGDIASVAAQYSYLQSPLALILETRSGLEQARALIQTIHSYWKKLPRETRPKLYMHGLSLGAWASMYGTDLFALLDEPIDGALWVGSPFPSTLWAQATAARNPDSPHVAPVVGDGRLIRFATNRQAAGGPAGWGSMRLMFLQYPSDPIVFYEPASVWRAPAWMHEALAEDVSPAVRFIPVVTKFQLALDMALANRAPPGYGHAYHARDYIDAWVAVTDPENWTDEDTARLARHCDNGFRRGCR